MIVEVNNTINLDSSWNISGSRHLGINAQQSYSGSYMVDNIKVFTLNGTHKSGGSVQSWDTDSLTGVYLVEVDCYPSGSTKEDSTEEGKRLFINSYYDRYSNESIRVLNDNYPWNIIEENQ